VIDMSDADELQNSRLRDLENRVNEVENSLASIMTELNNIKTLAKGLLMIAGLALGVDVVPMLEG
jgi:archaellum component FlaC